MEESLFHKKEIKGALIEKDPIDAVVSGETIFFYDKDSVRFYDSNKGEHDSFGRPANIKTEPVSIALNPSGIYGIISYKNNGVVLFNLKTVKIIKALESTITISHLSFLDDKNFIGIDESNNLYL